MVVVVALVDVVSKLSIDRIRNWILWVDKATSRVAFIFCPHPQAQYPPPTTYALEVPGGLEGARSGGLVQRGRSACVHAEPDPRHLRPSHAQRNRRTRAVCARARCRDLTPPPPAFLSLLVPTELSAFPSPNVVFFLLRYTLSLHLLSPGQVFCARPHKRPPPLGPAPAQRQHRLGLRGIGSVGRALSTAEVF